MGLQWDRCDKSGIRPILSCTFLSFFFTPSFAFLDRFFLPECIWTMETYLSVYMWLEIHTISTAPGFIQSGDVNVLFVFMQTPKQFGNFFFLFFFFGVLREFKYLQIMIIIPICSNLLFQPYSIFRVLANIKLFVHNIQYVHKNRKKLFQRPERFFSSLLKMVLQWLALWPHSKTVPGLKGLSVGALHVLPVSV